MSHDNADINVIVFIFGANNIAMYYIVVSKYPVNNYCVSYNGLCIQCNYTLMTCPACMVGRMVAIITEQANDMLQDLILLVIVVVLYIYIYI